MTIEEDGKQYCVSPQKNTKNEAPEYKAIQNVIAFSSYSSPRISRNALLSIFTTVAERPLTSRRKKKILNQILSFLSFYKVSVWYGAFIKKKFQAACTKTS